MSRCSRSGGFLNSSCAPADMFRHCPHYASAVGCYRARQSPPATPSAPPRLTPGLPPLGTFGPCSTAASTATPMTPGPLAGHVVPELSDEGKAPNAAGTLGACYNLRCHPTTRVPYGTAET